MRAPCWQRGLTLIEALVAMAVMAFGMLGLVGLQSTMRANADISKQRAEAVRYAQQAIENARAYDSLTGSAHSFDTIVDATTSITPDDSNSNATFTVVTSVPTATTNPPLKTVNVDVSWLDRTSTTQKVSFNTLIAGVLPELAAASTTSGLAQGTFGGQGRNPVIPPAAVLQPDGTSTFVPPGSSGVGWVFDNTSGVIKTCDISFTTCTGPSYLLLSGYVRFGYSASPPDASTAETPPPDPPLAGTGVEVDLTNPVTPPTVTCYIDPKPTYFVYYCAVPTSPTPLPIRWSGRSIVTGLTGLIAADAADADAGRYRVCRYTPQKTNTPSGGNGDHPLNYANVTTGLVNQNFLVIRAGNGSTAFVCPDDNTATTLVNTQTYAHQPPLLPS